MLFGRNGKSARTLKCDCCPLQFASQLHTHTHLASRPSGVRSMADRTEPKRAAFPRCRCPVPRLLLYVFTTQRCKISVEGLRDSSYCAERHPRGLAGHTSGTRRNFLPSSTMNLHSRVLPTFPQFPTLTKCRICIKPRLSSRGVAVAVEWMETLEGCDRAGPWD